MAEFCPTNGAFPMTDCKHQLFGCDWLKIGDCTGQEAARFLSALSDYVINSIVIIMMFDLKFGPSQVGLLPGSLQRLYNLEVLRLSDSDLQSLYKVNGRLDKVTLMDLIGNEINYIEDGFFLSFPSVSEVVLSYNKLQLLSSDIFVLTIIQNNRNIDMSHNEIMTGTPSPNVSLPVCDRAFYPGNSALDLRNNKINHIQDLFHGWGYNDSQILCWVQRGLFDMIDIRENPLVLDCKDCFIYREGIRMNKSLFKETKTTGMKSLKPRGITQPDVDNMYCDIDPLLCPDCTCKNYTCASVAYLGCHHVHTMFPNIDNVFSTINVSFNNLTILYQDITTTFGMVEMLHLQHNHIRVIEDGFFQSFQNAVVIDLSYNNLSSTQLVKATLDKLEQLNLSHNNIAHIDEGFFLSFPNAVVIDLSYNYYLVSLVKVNVTLHSLKMLCLSHNQVKYIEDGFFSSFPNVQDIDLSSNNLQSMPSQMFILVVQLGNAVIDVSSNALMSGIPSPSVPLLVCDGTPLPGNSVMDLSYNNIRHIQDLFHGWGYNDSQILCWVQKGIFDIAHIEDNPLVLDCKDQFIYSDALKGGKLSLFNEAAKGHWPHSSRKTQTLRDMTQCDIDSMHCDIGPYLCPHNCICYHYSHEAITHLGCHHGHHGHISNMDCKNLTIFPNIDNIFTPNDYYNINITDSDIKYLQNQPYFNRVKILVIYNSSLTAIDTLALDELGTHLEVLDLRHNMLTTLKQLDLDSNWQHLKQLYLSHNPWHCDCALKWLKRFIERFESDKYDVRCATPDSHKGTAMINLDEEQFQCGSMDMLIGISVAFVLCIFILIIAVILKRKLRDV